VAPAPHPTLVPAHGEREIGAPSHGGEIPAEPALAPNRGEGWGEGKRASRWIRICAVDEIPQLGARVVRRKGEANVAVFRTADDKLFALADQCPHRGGPLSQGIVYGDRVACPLHNTCVDLASGCAVAPDKGQVQSFAVRVEDGAVHVDLPVKADVDRQVAHQRQESPLALPERGGG
jgi:nitrite reductase (NADH) small subunit